MEDTERLAERPICFIGDQSALYTRSLPRLQQSFQTLFHGDVAEPETAASLSSVMVLSPQFLGVEAFHRLAGFGPVDRLLVVTDADAPNWSTNQLTHPFTPQELVQAIQQTYEGQLECRLTQFPVPVTTETTDPRHPGRNLAPFEVGDRVVSRTTPSLGEGLITQAGDLLLTVRFPNAPGKLANHSIRCHVSVLRRVEPK